MLNKLVTLVGYWVLVLMLALLEGAACALGGAMSVALLALVFGWNVPETAQAAAVFGGVVGFCFVVVRNAVRFFGDVREAALKERIRKALEE